MTVGLFGVTVVVMSENVRKLVGVVAMAALVVVGVVATSGGDDDFTRNSVFIKLGDFRQLPEAQQARLAPKFLQQAAPEALDTGPINQINKEGGPIFKGAKASIWSTGGAHALSTGKASVLEGRGVYGKGGKSSIIDHWLTPKPNKAGIVGGTMCSARKFIACADGVDGVADRIAECASGGTGFTASSEEQHLAAGVKSLTKVLVSSYTGVIAAAETVGEAYNCQDLSGNGGAFSFPYPGLPLLLAECMESKVGGVLLKSHTEVMAADCVATVMPALSPDRAKRLGTYWQTQQQLTSESVHMDLENEE